jgi:hypothetical protein
LYQSIAPPPLRKKGVIADGERLLLLLPADGGMGDPRASNMASKSRPPASDDGLNLADRLAVGWGGDVAG